LLRKCAAIGGVGSAENATGGATGPLSRLRVPPIGTRVRRHRDSARSLLRPFCRERAPAACKRWLAPWGGIWWGQLRQRRVRGWVLLVGAGARSQRGTLQRWHTNTRRLTLTLTLTLALTLGARSACGAES